jgi:transcriptional regulator with XRE-family HTH domain
MRKHLQFTIEDLSKSSRVSHNVIARLERNETRKMQPWVLGRILPLLAARFKETFPEAQGDPYDFLIPPTTFGGWMKNFRARRGLKLKELAKALKVHCYTVIRYEANLTKPDAAVRDRLRRALGSTGSLTAGCGNPQARWSTVIRL